MTDTTRTYTVDGMDCAECAKTLEKAVSRLDSVQRVRVDFNTGKLSVDGPISLDDLNKRARAVGFGVRDAAESTTDEKPVRKGVLGFWDYLLSRFDTRMALLGGALLVITALASLVGVIASPLPEILFTLATITAGYPVAKSGLTTLFINRDLNINLLMTIAAVGAILIGETLEAAMVIFLFSIGEALEGFTAAQARYSIKSLIDLAPSTAIRVEKAAVENDSCGCDDGCGCGDSPTVDVAIGNISVGDIGIANTAQMPTSSTDEVVERLTHEEVVPVEALHIGDVILVKGGERVPMDGDIVTGQSDINQAPITGESIPVHKTTGDEVYAGSVNGSGTLTVRVTHLAEDNTLSRIIRMVEEAQGRRAPSQRVVDQFARWYTPAVVVIAFLVATIPPVFFGAPFLSDGDTVGWLYRALAMLVIACPCALVISTPVTVISAITAAARQGVLIKGGAHLEALGVVKAFAFDKTGTLTRGEPVVTQNRALDCESPGCEECDDVLALAAAVERHSTHPLARAVVEAANARGLTSQYATAHAVETLAGRGVRGEVDGRPVTVASHAYFDAEYPHEKAFCDIVDEAEAHGQTTMLVSDAGKIRGFVAVADTPRDESGEVIKALHNMGGTVAMLTGDNAAVAHAVGAQIGVDDVRANLLPGDKVTAVEALREKHGTVVMIGDGINDTPALAAATVSVAMGGAGSASALETADIALMQDGLKQLPDAVRLARFARRLIVQNVAISFVVKALFLVLAFFGGTTLWVAVLADMGVSLLVTLNGMRPLRSKHGPRP